MMSARTSSDSDENGGIWPRPYATTSVTASRVWRLSMSTSVGMVRAGSPWRSRPWHATQLTWYCRRPRATCVVSFERSIGNMWVIHAMLLLFTKKVPLAGSNAWPPHSAPPSKPGKTTVPSSLGGCHLS